MWQKLKKVKKRFYIYNLNCTKFAKLISSFSEK